MKRSEEEFWHSAPAKVIKMIYMYADEMNMKAAAMNNQEYQSKYFNRQPEAKLIKSMKEIPGW